MRAALAAVTFVAVPVALAGCGTDPGPSPASSRCSRTAPDAVVGDLDAVLVRVEASYTPDATDGVAADTAAARTVTSGQTGGPVDVVRACQRLQLSLHVTAAGGSAPQQSVAPGHVRVRTHEGRGELLWVENRTGNEEMDPGTGAADFAGFSGWYGLVVDPAPGIYRWDTRVSVDDTTTREPHQVGTAQLTLTLGDPAST